MSEIETKQFEPYYGLGGWLLYLQIGLGINLVIIIYRLANIISIMHLNWLDAIKLLFTTLYGIPNVLVIIGIIACFISLWMKSMMFRIFYVSIHAVSFLSVILIGLFSDLSYLLNLIGVSIGASIWITYVFKSERIKNTLRKVGQEKTEYEIYIEEEKSESLANNQNELQENIR